MLNLKAQYASIAGEISQAVLAVLESQSLILGPDVAALESELADYCQVAHAV